MGKLKKDEQELLDSYEKNEWQPIKKKKSLVKKYQSYAKATFKKNKRVNIRISSKDLEGIQRRALEEGIPYQTLISSIIHKFISGTLNERRV